MPENPENLEPDLQTIAAQAEAIDSKMSNLAQDLSSWISSQNWVPDSLTHALALLILFLGILAASSLVYLVFRPLVLRGVSRFVNKSKTNWDNQLMGHGVFRWLTHLLPGIFIYLVAPGLFESAPFLAKVMRTASSLYIIISCYLVFDSIINGTQAIYSKTPGGKKINLTTFAQVAKLLAALIAIILALAVLLGKSPLVLLGGLGVFASVLMLVFKDVILGFIAGIQLSTNRMLALGDWLEMPSHQADGNVEMIGLTTVKVRNWDKTVTTIPTYALISDSFKNWRGMSESSGRRIKRSFQIDTNSIRLCDDEMLARFRKIEHISAYLDAKEKEISQSNSKIDEARLQNRVNGRRLTNIGTFRAYIELYLKAHPDINQEMTLLVRQLSTTGRGIPIEIYCFSSNKEWNAYEGIQADIFDHLHAVAPEFDLRIFQEPTGNDFQQLTSAQ
ncbi:mechanosensitive ion channel family protein [Akkermansiaceae bacterium]|nr:mechanosensitive ion channel family protein [Akkermansiaceae bacterium]MDC0265416.1 mechanosensitive ion channel family protein [bacterium]MDB4273360.1 mechanosensitive ion channel family protein [Akkermansiaceae bacterium]MDB4332197.1 mechanosensitive ion channel family protein [Akkermansiaceae bacterium]MDB4615374.1 mechanosensitive ion channel family protein [Akkermansiaceae bacterium]